MTGYFTLNPETTGSASAYRPDILSAVNLFWIDSPFLRHVFQALLKAGFLHRNLFLLIRFDLLMKLGIIHDEGFEDKVLTESDHVSQEVVIAQTSRIAVEPNQQHDRHQVHDPLHLTGHSGALCVV